VRGGSWNDNARRVRSAYRNANHPGDADDNPGFRLCLSSMPAAVDAARGMDQPRVPPAVVSVTAANRKAPGAPVGAAADALHRTPPGRRPGSPSWSREASFPVPSPPG
jgi:hypothetical protein